MRNCNDKTERMISDKKESDHNKIVRQNVITQEFANLFCCSSCNQLMGEASICKYCGNLICKICKDNQGHEGTVNELGCHWCKFESMICLWLPEIVAKFKTLSVLDCLSGPVLYSELKTSFECKICMSMPRKTCLCPCCSQPLCCSCFRKSLAESATCPLCREPLQVDEIVPCLWTDNIVAELLRLSDVPVDAEEEYDEAEHEESDEAEHEESDDEHQAPQPYQEALFMTENDWISLPFRAMETTQNRIETVVSNLVSIAKHVFILVLVILVGVLPAYSEVAHWKSFVQLFNKIVEQQRSAQASSSQVTSYEICLMSEILLLAINLHEDFDSSKQSQRLLFNCLKKQQQMNNNEEDTAPCFLLLAHTDNSAGRASADRLTSGISELLARCGSSLNSGQVAAEHRCADAEHRSDRVSGTNCALFRELQRLLPKDLSFHRFPSSVRLFLLTMGLPDGYAPTKGAVLYRLSSLWSSGNGAIDVKRLSRLLDGNILPVGPKS